MERTSEKDSTREAILNAALILLNKYGYGGLSLSALAEQVGMTKQRVHYHFPDISEVSLILARRWSETGQQMAIEALAESNEVGEFKVLAIADGMFRWMKAYPDLSRLGLVLFQSSPHVTELDEFMNGARAVARKRIKSFLLQSPRFAKKADKQVEAAVTEVHSYMYGFGFYVIIMNDMRSLERYREICLNGLRSRLESFS